jgi:hypothetical protein
MTQQDRDRLVVLKKAKKGLITQREAAVELGQSERRIRRLLVKLKEQGDRAIVHKLRGRASNRRLAAKDKQKASEILGRDVYRGFGPTLASEYLSKHHEITVSRETVRAWMMEAKLWRAKKQRIEKIHEWRTRFLLPTKRDSLRRLADQLLLNTHDHRRTEAEIASC